MADDEVRKYRKAFSLVPGIWQALYVSYCIIIVALPVSFSNLLCHLGLLPTTTTGFFLTSEIVSFLSQKIIGFFLVCEHFHPS